MPDRLRRWWTYHGPWAVLKDWWWLRQHPREARLLWALGELANQINREVP